MKVVSTSTSEEKYLRGKFLNVFIYTFLWFYMNYLIIFTIILILLTYAYLEFCLLPSYNLVHFLHSDFVRVFLCFAGVFIFGAFTLMVFVDVTKLMTGRLRPNFLELCKVNVTACRMNGNHGDDSMCQEKDEMVIKHARQRC